LENVNTPKVEWDKQRSEAIMFSRKVIACADGTHYRHIGMYAYRADVLREITQLPQSPLEIQERLEQLRWLENGYRIRVAVTNVPTIGIDTPEDLEKAIEWYKRS
jgi:3-deoxy-manno-octulosonate cytidylyltransferase (CMP-KDO synthetase)